MKIDPTEVRGWLEDLEDDWLREQMETALDVGTNWDIAMAAGLHARFLKQAPSEWDLDQFTLQENSPALRPDW